MGANKSNLINFEEISYVGQRKNVSEYPQTLQIP